MWLLYKDPAFSAGDIINTHALCFLWIYPFVIIQF